MSFKVGQRVRYTGNHPTHCSTYIGWEGTVEWGGRGENTGVHWDQIARGNFIHYSANLELIEPLSGLERSIAAYIAAEKKELGLV